MSAQRFVVCPKCQARLDVDAAWAGRRARCKKCRNEFELQTSSMVERPTRSLQQSVDTPLDTANETMLGPGRTPSLRNSSVEIANRGVFSRFELMELLGEGAFGKVYKARDPNLGRLVALKIPTFSAAELKKTSRFLDEAKSAAALRHKNIVPIYEAGMFQGRPFIVSEFIEGQTLSERIGGEPVSYRTAATWIRDLALALQYAHDNGIIHRDVKSENIMLDVNQVPFLMDFGLAKRLHEDSTRTLDGTVLGTPAYMPPEQAKGDQKMIGPRSDQYSLAVVLYELLCRQRPFSGQPHSVLAQVISAQPRLPSSILRGVPKHLEAICLKAMSKDIEVRYPSASQFAADLDCYLEGKVPSAYARKIRFRLPKLNSKYQHHISMASVLVALLLCGIVASRFNPSAAKRSTEELVLKPKSNSIGANPTKGKQSDELRAEIQVIPETPQKTPINFEAERKAAEWLLSVGADAHLVSASEAVLGSIRSMSLPKTSFYISPWVNIAGLDVDDAAIAALAGCTRIESIDLGNNPKLTANGLLALRSCKMMRDVKLFKTTMNDQMFSVFRSWPELRELRIAYSPSITLEGLQSLEDSRNLKVLDAGYCNLGRSGKLDVSRLRHISHLGLNANNLTDRQVTGFENLSQTVLLDISGNLFSDLVAEKISKNQSLQELVIGERISDKGFLELAKIPNLTHLTIPPSKVTPNGVQEFQKLRPDVILEGADEVLGVKSSVKNIATTPFAPVSQSPYPGFCRLAIVGKKVDVHEIRIAQNGIESTLNRYDWPTFEVNGVNWEPEKSGNLELRQTGNAEEFCFEGSMIEVKTVPGDLQVSYRVNTDSIEFYFEDPPPGAGDCSIILDIPYISTVSKAAFEHGVTWKTLWDTKVYHYDHSRSASATDIASIRQSSPLSVYKTDSIDYIFWRDLRVRHDALEEVLPANFLFVTATREFLAQAGTYRVESMTDDRMQVWINDRLVIDNWNFSGKHRFEDLELANGKHVIRFEYLRRDLVGRLFANVRRIR